MKRTILTAAFFLFIAVAATAQTKRIAQRSHSGNSKKISMKGEDNFGLSPEMEKKLKEDKARKDSLAKKDATKKTPAKKTQPVKQKAVKPKQPKNQPKG